MESLKLLLYNAVIFLSRCHLKLAICGNLLLDIQKNGEIRRSLKLSVNPSWAEKKSIVARFCEEMAMSWGHNMLQLATFRELQIYNKA